MNDLRSYSFGDWFHLFLRVVPAFLLAGIVIALPVALLFGLVWLFVPLGPR